jgi:Predicted nucleoside-diphosphate-sugar epimerase
MISEAIYSKNPVFIYRLKSLKKINRIENFIDSLLDKGYIKLLPNLIEEFSHKYENETEEVARRIHQMYIERNDIS